ncbi:hypothetical protein EWM64_g7075 [Hericium alpestre]|uniref:Uncharacterized protein n=1 Tax=Hericium alpestre TaxID=135208 RepID=A0A4Y9ZTX5_9AGAM|nr:hypothetical protein EWM64_g7075 [Hericium alpestre]
MIPAMPPHVSAIVGPSPLIAPKIPLLQQLSPIAQTPEAQLSSSELTPTAAHGKSQTESAARVPPVGNNDYFSVRVRGRSGSVAAAGSSTPDDFSGWSGPGTKQTEKSPEANLTVSGGGLMGRLKSLGRHKRPQSEHGPLPKSGIAGRASNASRTSHDTSAPGPATKTPAQIVLSGSLNPPSTPDGPTMRLVPSIPLAISEEASPSWNTLYRGTVASTAADMHALEETIPMWLMEYVLLNKATVAPITKLGFVLLPWHTKDPDAEKLPELLNVNQSKLTASRFLRVRKLMGHVHDKIDKLSGKATLSPTTPHVSPRTSSDTHNTASPRPEELWEIVCNDTILPPEMTLAAVRQFVWRQSAELTMFYRRKRSTAAVTNLPVNLG